jgi:hypothetical protein
MTSPSRSALIVEFSGIPGVGKSSVAHAVAAALATTGQSVDEPLLFVAPALARSRRLRRKLRLAAFEAVTHPLSSGTLAIAVARSGQSMGDFVHRVQNWLVVRALFRRSRRRSGVHLFDQGVVQELCSIGYRGDWRAALRSAAPGADDLAPDLIVRVTAPVEAVQQRLAARAGADRGESRSTTVARARGSTSSRSSPRCSSCSRGRDDPRPSAVAAGLEVELLGVVVEPVERVDHIAGVNGVDPVRRIPGRDRLVPVGLRRGSVSGDRRTIGCRS